MNRIVSSALAYWRRPILRQAVFWIGLIIPLAVLYGPTLWAHIGHSTNPNVFNDDVRQQIFPFFKCRDAELFPHDYFGDYYRSCFFPIGYRAFYSLIAKFCDPTAVSKIVPYFLLALTVAAVASVTRRLAGDLGAFFATALVLSSSEVFLYPMVGGLPRAFAFPALGLTAVALVYGKPRLLAGVVCASAALYPPAAVPGGIALVMWLFLVPVKDRGSVADWSFYRRARLVTATVFICVVTLLPTWIGSRAYGRLLGPKDMFDYPETGPGGRYGPGDRPPFQSFLDDAFQEARPIFGPTGEPLSRRVQKWAEARAYPGANSNGEVILELLSGILIIGGIFFALQGPTARRFLLLGAAAWLAHLIARGLAPYFFFPGRYAEFPVPIVMVVLIPAAAAALGQQLSGGRLRGRWAGVMVIACVVLLPFAGRGSVNAGLNIDVTSERSLYDFLSSLPKDVLIAGWPTDLDNVPYASRRQVFITAELHQAFHQRYADEMRRRMRALVDAYFASDERAIVRLRDEFGVTHFIFQPGNLNEPPAYFEPFSGWIRQAFDVGRSKGFEMPAQLETAKVFSDGHFIVLDLKRVGAP